jgi:hypothetical protein
MVSCDNIDRLAKHGENNASGIKTYNDQSTRPNPYE